MTKKIIKAINKKTKALFVAHKISKMNWMKRMIAHKNATKMRIGLKKVKLELMLTFSDGVIQDHLEELAPHFSENAVLISVIGFSKIVWKFSLGSESGS